MKNSPIRRFNTVLLAGGALFVSLTLNAAQSKSMQPDLAGIPSEQGWKLINRSAETIDKDGSKGVHLDGKDSTGFSRLENFTFADGTIEFDARGQNIVQQSFLGIAFHGTDAKTYDAIYFRPFNFKHDDAERRSRAVQYISHPIYTWHKLRSEHPGQYEKPVSPAPNPDGWFHVRVLVEWPMVSVFVNEAKEPCLVARQLSDRKSGWFGLWTDVKGGDFANLKITSAP